MGNTVAMKQMTKDKDGDSPEEFDFGIDGYHHDSPGSDAGSEYSSQLQVLLNRIKFRLSRPAEGGDSLFLRGRRYREVFTTDEVTDFTDDEDTDILHASRHQPRQPSGSSEHIGRTFLDLARADASLGRKSDGPGTRPSRKIYGTTVLHSKILQHSGPLGDASIPTTISKDTSKGIEARNRSLLENFGTKKTQLGPPRNSPFILNACRRQALSRRREIMYHRHHSETVCLLDDIRER